MRPKYLVLLATHNAGPYLVDLLNSVLAQADVQVEILISDDHSSDDTSDICRTYCKRNKNIRILEHGKKFGSASRNFFSLVTSINFDVDDYNYIAFCDQDDIWEVNKLAVAHKFLEPGCYDGYSCSAEAFSDGNPASKILIQSKNITELDFLFEGAGQGCTFVMTSELMCSFQKFVLKYSSNINDLHYHDWTVYAYARTSNLNWYFDVNPYLMYRQHLGNDTGARQGFKAYFARAKLVKSGWYINQVRVLSHCLKSEFPLNPITSFICDNALLNGKKLKGVGVLNWLNTLLLLVKYGRRKKIDSFALGVFFVLGWLS